MAPEPLTFKLEIPEVTVPLVPRDHFSSTLEVVQYEAEREEEVTDGKG